MDLLQGWIHWKVTRRIAMNKTNFSFSTEKLINILVAIIASLFLYIFNNIDKSIKDLSETGNQLVKTMSVLEHRISDLEKGTKK